MASTQDEDEHNDVSYRICRAADAVTAARQMLRYLQGQLMYAKQNNKHKKIEELEKHITWMKSQLNKLDDALDEELNPTSKDAYLQAEVNNLKYENEALSAKVGPLEKKVEGLESGYKRLKRANRDLKKANEDLEKANEDLKAEVKREEAKYLMYKRLTFALTAVNEYLESIVDN